MYDESIFNIRNANFVRKCWIRAINKINRYENLHVVAGLYLNTYETAVNMDGFDLYSQWAGLYNCFKYCFFDIIYKEYQSVSAICTGCGMNEPINCAWNIEVADGNVNMEGWEQDPLIKRIVRCCDYNPYWILAPFCILANNINGNKDEIIKNHFVSHNIVLDYLDCLPFYFDSDLVPQDINEIKNLISEWFKSLISKTNNKEKVYNWLNNLFNYEIVLSYDQRIERVPLKIDCEKSLNELVADIEKIIGKYNYEYCFENVKASIIKALSDSHRKM